MKIRFVISAVTFLFLLHACGKKSNLPGINVIAGFSISGFEVAAPCTITLINVSSNATSYLWNFGDGNTSTQFSPTHTYNTAGSYLLQLTATGSTGSKSVCKLVSIEAVSPNNKSGFSYFFDKCSGTPVGASFKTINPLSTNVKWDFDNGISSLNRDPIIQFLFPGDYTIKYSSQINGVRDTVIRIIQIQ